MSIDHNKTGSNVREWLKRPWQSSYHLNSSTGESGPGAKNRIWIHSLHSQHLVCGSSFSRS